jgi:peptidoglycan/LPS O-acetylase OafA/YrhL
MKNENTIIKTKKLYLGIEILRMLFAFIIVFFHCRNKKIYSQNFNKYLGTLVGLGLATFFIISFHFSYNSFTRKNINRINERFKRFLTNYINGKNNNILFKLLIYQFLIGNGIYVVHWFLFNLIFILLLFIIIIFITKKYMVFLIFLGLIAILISSSNKYYNFWNGYNNIVSFSIKPIINTYKCGLIGFFLSLIKIIEKHKTKKYLLLCIFIIFLWIEINNNYFKEILKKFFSIFLILIFASIPFDKLKFSIFSFIKQISRYTGGIYYIHVFVNSLLKKYVSFKFNSGNMFMCIILYFICYFICFIGCKLCKNNILKFLFI